MVHITCCFQCPSAVVENGKSHLCLISCVFLFFSFSISRGKFYTSIYYFLVASGNKRFFLKCPCGWSSSPKTSHDWKNTNIVFSRVVLSMWTNGSRMSFECIEKKDLEMTARKKTTMSCPYFFLFYKKQTGPTSTPNSWSGAPTSIGAMSMMGRRDVFDVL